MNDTRARLRLLGMAGSLRKHSHSRATLVGLQRSLREGQSLDIADLQLPLYNEDEDGIETTADVRRFRHAVASSDGVVIVTPEYNHSISGVLKNALDWASRPHGRSALIRKPVMVISISPAFTGGVRAQAHLHEILLAIEALIVPGPQVVIGGAAHKVSNGVLVDQSSLSFASAALERLIALCHIGEISLCPSSRMSPVGEICDAK